MNRVIIMRGVSGSGKSTFARQNYPRAVVVSADDHFYVGGEYEFRPHELGIAHANCFWKFLQFLNRRAPLIVVDNTNTRPLEVSPYVLGAEAHGYAAEVVTLIVNPYIAAQRNAHRTPRDVILRSAQNLKEPMPPHWNTRIVRR